MPEGALAQVRGRSRRREAQGVGAVGGTTRVVCKANSLKLLKESIKDALKQRLRHAAAPTTRTSARRKRRSSRRSTSKLFKQVPLRRDPGCGRRVGQQRPRRRHARRLHRADCPRASRPTTRAATGSRSRTTRARRAPTPTATSRDLPQRPEPARGHRALSPGRRRRSRRSTTATGSPTSGPCIRCNLQLEGSGVSADDVVVDAGNVAAGNGGPPKPGQGRRAQVDRADGFVLRNMTFRHAAEHGDLPARGRRLPARALQDLPQRGVRRPDVHLGPRPDHGLRGGGERRRRPLPGRRRPTPASRSRRRHAAAQHRDPQLRHAPQHRGLLRHRLATRSGSTTTTSTTTRSASPPTSSPPRATRASPRTPT